MARHHFGLAQVRRDERRVTTDFRSLGLGVHQDGNSPLPCLDTDPFDQLRCHRALAIVRNDERVEPVHGARDLPRQLRLGCGGDSFRPLEVQSQKLVRVRDDADFPRRRPAGVCDESPAGNSAGSEELSNIFSALVAADGAEGDGPSIEGADVGGHVARTAGKTLARFDFAHHPPFGSAHGQGAKSNCELVEGPVFGRQKEDRHGRFRRDARRLADQQLIEHEISQDTDSSVSKTPNDLGQGVITALHGESPGAVPLAGSSTRGPAARRLSAATCTCSTFTERMHSGRS